MFFVIAKYYIFFSEKTGRWEDNRTADEVVEDIRGARTLNREIGL